MEIEKVTTPNGKTFIKFKDHYDTPCEMNTGYHNLEFQVHLDDEVSPTCTVFTQEDVRALLPYLQAFAESGTLELQESTLQGEEQLAQTILEIIASKSSYVTAWSICDDLGIERSELCCSIPGTKYDKALEQLIDAGVVEELQNLAHRYRLAEKYRNVTLQECLGVIHEQPSSPLQNI